MLAFDTETYLITRNNTTPKPVCCQWYDPRDRKNWLTEPNSPETYALLADPDTLLVGQEIAYDIAVMMRWCPWSIPLFFKAMDEGRVRCTAIRECLMYMATKGGFGFPESVSLEGLCRDYLGIDLSLSKKGEDIWRLRYGELDGVPFNRWPIDAINYALDDARLTYQVAEQQGMFNTTLPTEELQVSAAVALKLMSAWGMAVDHQVNNYLITELKAVSSRCDELIESLGWTGKGSKKRLQDAVTESWNYKQRLFIHEWQKVTGVDIDWSDIPQDVDLAVARAPGPMGPVLEMVKKAKGFPTPSRTKTGIKADKDSLNDLEGCYPVTGPDGNKVSAFDVLLEKKHAEKMLSTCCRALEGVDAVHADYRAIVGTGRTACRGPNLQNWPARDKLPMRDAFKPRDGYLYGTYDYSALELCTLSATLRDFWPNVRCHLGEAIDNDRDAHCIIASIWTGLPYEQIFQGRKTEYKLIRQKCKAGSFGLPGGMQAPTLMAYAKSMGTAMSMEEANQIIGGWARSFPELVDPYLKYCETAARSHGTATLINGRQKARCRKTQFANYHFQGLAVDGAKAATYSIIKECILGGYYLRRPWAIGYGSELRDSPLNRSHLVNMIHDETLVEHPAETAQEAGKRQGEIMVDEMNKTCKNLVKISVEGQISEKWDH